MVLGYAPLTKKIKQGTTSVVNFELVAASSQTAEVVIRPDDGPNPAIALMKKVIRNKKINNREKLDAYEYEAYNKVEFDLNNITEKFQDRKIFNAFEFVFEGVDTTHEKPYLPVFMTESLSDFYFKRNPKLSKEVVKATKVSGVENESINQFLGDMYQNINVYDNELVAFSKSFTSPLSTYALGFYDYGLVDSATIDGKWCYKLQFFPRRKAELLFFGEMWIADTSFAVKEIEATIAEGANINWIKDFKVKQTFNEIEPEVWMLTKDELVVDFNVSEKKLGAYGRKTSSYRNFVINKERPQEYYEGYFLGTVASYSPYRQRGTHLPHGRYTEEPSSVRNGIEHFKSLCKRLQGHRQLRIRSLLHLLQLQPHRRESTTLRRTHQQ